MAIARVTIKPRLTLLEEEMARFFANRLGEEPTPRPIIETYFTNRGYSSRYIEDALCSLREMGAITRYKRKYLPTDYIIELLKKDTEGMTRI